MRTEIRLQFEHIIRFALGDQRHTTTLYKDLMRPILVKATKTKLNKTYCNSDSTFFVGTANN